MPFAFYDLETTGTDPAFDQPLQFAAILVDDDLNEIERVDMRCRLAPHVLPGPYAMVVTGLSPADVEDETLPSYLTFAQGITALIRRWAPATWVGYNTIAFDEPFLRQLFYQTLQPVIYQTQFDGNDRLDIMLAVQAVWAKAPQIFEWPTNAQGLPVLKLDQLAPANGYADHDAHDALGDVEATIHLARIIRDRAPELWRQIVFNRTKHDVANALRDYLPMDLVVRFRGPPKILTGCFCGFSAGNANSAGFFDLDAGDPADLIDGDDALLQRAVTDSPLLIREVAINAAPSLFRTVNPTDEMIAKSRLIAERPDFQMRVGQALKNRFSDRDPEEDRPVEKRIFDGFYTNADKARLRDFQTVDWVQKADLAGQFEDVRLRQMARRLVTLLSPKNAAAKPKAAAIEYLNTKWGADNDANVGWTSFASAEADLNEIAATESVPAETIQEWRSFYQRKQDQLAEGTWG